MILKTALVYRQHNLIVIHVNYSLIRQHIITQLVHLQATQYKKSKRNNISFTYIKIASEFSLPIYAVCDAFHIFPTERDCK